MYNKISSAAVRGSRRPGRPFNTTTYPWRSTAIGRSFILNQKNCTTSMRWKLQQEGVFFSAIRIDKNSWLMTRVA